MVEPIRNQRLKKEYEQLDENVFGEFECFLCRSLKTRYRYAPTENYMADSKHFKCPMPPPYPRMSNKPRNYEEWQSILQVGKCQAYALDKLLQKNVKFSKAEFDQLTETEYENCLNI